MSTSRKQETSRSESRGQNLVFQLLHLTVLGCGDQVNLDCMYVYISPKEVDPDPAKVLAEAGICSQTRDLYLGLVSENSDTHHAMNQLIARLL